MKFQLSVNPRIKGKSREGLGGVWEPVMMTHAGLLSWLYERKSALTHAILDVSGYDIDRQVQGLEKLASNRRYDYFKGSNVLVIDIDWSDDFGPEVFEKLKRDNLINNPFLAQYLQVAVPSSSYHPEDRPNWHLFFQINATITDPRHYRALALVFQTIFTEATGIPADKALATAVQPTYGTVWKDERMGDTYPREYAYMNPTADLIALDDLLERYVAEVPQRKQHERRTYERSEQAQKHVEAHNNLQMGDRERLVIEALGYALEGWGSQDYGDWTRLWMSAQMGCPTDSVLEFILNHPDIDWGAGDEDEAKRVLTDNWERHLPRAENPITVATLFWMAREKGWLQSTDYELSARHIQLIDTPRISDWVAEQDNLPPIVLLQSQTGTGKTYNLIKLYKQLDQPKTVVFSPTVKLAADLAGVLQRNGVPAVLYRDQAGNRIAPQEMEGAHVLVTTLQSFATQVHKRGTLMSNYGLVYLEEADQLITGFVRSSTGVHASHVSSHEARAGLEVLRDAIQNAGHVWAVDATMTEVTRRMIRSFNGDRQIGVYRNVYTKRKAPVMFVDSEVDALQMAHNALVADRRVVVVCDTAAGVRRATQTLSESRSLEGKVHISITAETGHQRDVRAFLADVDTEAPKYDLVAYNSAMGSGVSITSVKPDLVVQIADYLAPRQNLQMLNRYRSQKAVVCYYTHYERFHTITSHEIMEQATARVQEEAMQLGVRVADRDEVAQVKDKVAAISIADEMAQRRAPREFYRTLLKYDGREVHDAEDELGTDAMMFTMDEVKSIMKERREYIASNWRSHPIVDKDNPPDPDADLLAVACGIRHGEIHTALWGNIPNDYSDEDIDAVVRRMGGYGFTLFALTNTEAAMVYVMKRLGDETRGFMTFSPQISKLRLLSKALLMFDYSLEQPVASELWDARAPVFLSEMAALHETYDKLVDHTVRYEKLYLEDDAAFALTYRVFALFGLRLSRRKERDGYVYLISNFDKAKLFVQWRYEHEIQDAVLAMQAFEPREHELLVKFQKLAPHQRMQAFLYLQSGARLDIAISTARA